jgi:succinate-acetate transporter protein
VAHAGSSSAQGGNTFNGVLLSALGAFWMALCFDLQFYLRAVPGAQAGHALALFLFAHASSPP